MSSVRKWYIGVYGGEAQARTCSPHPNEVIRDREGDTFVLSRDHMAALASANSDKEAYAQNAIDLRKRVDALQALLTAADERLDAAVNLLEIWRTWLGPTRESCDDTGKNVWDRIDAVTALKPAEGGVDD